MATVKYKSGNNWVTVTTGGSIATDSTYGYVKIATTEDVEEGTSTSAVVCAKQLKDYSDENFVHLTGNETIDGDKTFTGDISKTGAFSNNPTVGIKVNDTNSKGYIETIAYYTSSAIYNRVLAHNNTANANAYVDVKCLDNGRSAFDTSHVDEVYAPTPTSATDNTTKVATTAHIVNVLKVIYPVGSIYIGTQNTCPMASLISGSTWEKIEGRYLLASGTLAGTSETYSATNTVASGLPDHSHSYQEWGRTGGGNVGYDTNNHRVFYDETRTTGNASSSNVIYGASAAVRSPAYVVNVWRRTA